MKTPVKLHVAMDLAERIQRELAPYCIPGFCQIAGSIRRARPEVGDIDMVALPRPGQLDRIKDRCKQRSRVITDGRQNFHFALTNWKTEFEVQVFFAHQGIDDLVEPIPTNFGTLLLCRTGSKEHNVMLCKAARELNMKWSPYQGLLAGGRWEGDEYIDGKIVASETEEQIYQALGMKWIAPAYREVNPTGTLLYPAAAAAEAGAART